MADLKRQLQIKGKEAAQNLGKFRSHSKGEGLRELRLRVDELEAEVQECRQLNLRLAELTDVVEELLLPVAARDEEKLAELLARYAKSL